MMRWVLAHALLAGLPLAAGPAADIPNQLAAQKHSGLGVAFSL
jgi:hypothetical protein